MKLLPFRKAAKTNLKNNKINTFKIRFTVLASIFLIAVSGAVAFSSGSTAAALGDLLFGGASFSDTLVNISKNDDSKKDGQPSRRLEPAPDSSIGGLAAARSGHTATVLADGRILIAGGDARGTAEILDPATGESSSAGSLSVARSGHTATKLSDGRVLITGGFSGGKAVASTEIYDNGAFVPGANLKAARAGHTATVLADGRILIAGGDARGTAEIVDAAAQNSETIKARLETARAFHSAALMGGGDVLIVGGSAKDGSAVQSGEIFNLETLTFSAANNSLHSARVRPILRELPDGKVQIIGGNDEGSMEIYTPDGNRFSAFAHVIPGRKAEESFAFKHRGAKAGIFNANQESGATAAESEVMRTVTRAALINHGEASDSLLNRSDYALVEIPGANQVLIIGGRNDEGEILNTLITAPDSAATITTDRLDYPPGEIVTITGTGFEPGETVQLKLVRDPVFPNNPEGIILISVADENGNFVNTNYTTTEDDLNTSFVLTALGLTSGRTAQTTFTDARQFRATIFPSSVNTLQSVTYTITITNTNTAGTATQLASVSILLPTNYSSPPTIGTITAPSGKTWNPVVATNVAGFSGGYNSGSRLIGLRADGASSQLAPTESITVQVTTNAPAAAGNYVWTATAYSNLNLNGTTFDIQIPPGQPTVTVNTATNPLPTTTSISPSSKTIGDAESTLTINGTNFISGSVVRFNGLNRTTTFVSSTQLTASILAGDLTANGTFPITVFNPTPGGGTSNAQTFTVNKRDTATSVSLTSGANPSTYGDSLTFTATVSGSGAGAGNPSGGTVQFKDGATNLGTAQILSGGTAVITTLALTAGSHSITAVYSGETNFNTSTSGALSQTVNKATPTITWANPADITYGTALSATQLNATASVAGSFVYTPALGAVLNAGNQTLAVSFTPTDAAKYNNASKNVSINVLKATTTTTVTCPTNATYTGAALAPCSATVTGANGLNDSLTVSYSNNTNAGTASASATYAESANYFGSSDSKNFTIDKANSTTVVTCPTNVTYTGAAQTPCTATVTGAGLNLTPTPSYSNNTNAGTAAASYTFAGDANHNGSSDSKNFTIDKAVTATVLTCPTSVTYTGAAIEPCSATVMGAGNLSQSVSVVYANNTNAGTASATATFAETANHLGSSDSENFTIDKAATTTTLICPTNVTYTGAAQTPCTATVTGANLSQSLTVNYSNNTNAGTASASASYAGTANHLGSSDSKNFTIDKAATVTAVSCPANVTYTGAAQTPCTATVTGANLDQSLTVSYSNNVNAGTAAASATYAESANYLGSWDNKDFTINKAATTTVVTCPTTATYTGAALTPCTAAVTGASLSESLTVSYSNNTNAGTASASASFTETANHLGSFDSKNFTINKAATATIVTCPANVAYNGSAQTPCTAAVTGAGGLNQSLTVGYDNNVNAGIALASATYAETANYLGSGDSENFTIDKAVTATVVTCQASATYTGSAIEPCTATVMGAGSLNQAVAVVYSNNVDAGAASATATYAGNANYLGSTDSKNFTINKAATTTTVTCPTNATYTGAAIEPCTATVTGAGGLNQAVALVYSANVNAGTASATATFVETANYFGSSDSKNFVIDKAATTTVVTCPANITYTGSALTPCTATATGASLNQSLTVSYANNVNAGTAGANASFAETANHLGSSDSKNFTIDKAPSTTTVSGGGTFTFNGLPRPASVSVTGAGGLNLNPAPVYSGNCGAAPVTIAQTPCTASYTYAGDANHNGSSNSTIINITAAPTTTSVSVMPNSQQYSDKVSFTATIAPGFANIVPAATGVTFYVGTQAMNSTPIALTASGANLTATLSDAALLEIVAGQMSPDSKTVRAVFSGVNSNFTVNNPTTPLTVTQENATANFSGATYFATSSSTSKTANITLSTTLIDEADDSRGDIRNAKVEFHLGTPTGTLLGGANLSVGLVNPADSTVGTATATNISYTLSQSEFDAKGTTITVYTVVKNYYTNTTTVGDPTTITISVPGTDGVTGGGHQVLTSSNGQYAGTNGSKMNFGFTMKYNNAGTNLKGQANIIVRSNGRIYQIKSNAVDSLAVIGTAYPKGATLTTKANMTDITNPLAPVPVTGNLRLQIEMTDAALGGQTDKVGITLFNGDGGLFFSSHWDGTKTVQQWLGGGNISVR